MRIDFEVSGGATVVSLQALDPSSPRWSRITCPTRRRGSAAVVIEHRYIRPIVGGAIGDGLVVQ